MLDDIKKTLWATADKLRANMDAAEYKCSPRGSLLDKAEQLTASVRAKVEHPLRVIKCQFGFTKVRYAGLAKKTF